MPTLDEVVTDPATHAMMQALTKEAQEITGLPILEAGCFLKCSLGAAQILSDVFPQIDRMIVNIEIANLLAGEPAFLLPQLIKFACLTEYPGTPNVYKVMIVLRETSEAHAITIPLTEEEVPTTPAIPGVSRRAWPLYPSKLVVCHHSPQAPGECPTCSKSATPALFMGKGVGAFLQRARGTLPPEN